MFAALFPRGARSRPTTRRCGESSGDCGGWHCDGRAIAAALALGASAVQMETAYLLCPEATISALHRAAIKSANGKPSAISNVLTGRPARVLVNRIVREAGPLASDVPSFPLGGTRT
jgi:nitronate monooxygenase